MVIWINRVFTYVWFFLGWGSIAYGLFAKDLFWFVFPVLVQIHWAAKLWIADYQMKIALTSRFERALEKGEIKL